MMKNFILALINKLKGGSSQGWTIYEDNGTWRFTAWSGVKTVQGTGISPVMTSSNAYWAWRKLNGIDN